MRDRTWISMTSNPGWLWRADAPNPSELPIPLPVEHGPTRAQFRPSANCLPKWNDATENKGILVQSHRNLS